MDTRRRRETELLEDFIVRLRGILPRDWSVRRGRLPQSVAWEPDAVLEVRAADGTRGRLALAIQPRLYPRDVVTQRPLWRSLAPSTPVLVLTSVLTARTREVLDAAGLSYADAAGSLRLVMASPAVFLERLIEGARRQAMPERRELQSLKTAAAGRGVRALCELRPPYGVREFATRAGLSPATASRLFEFLDREALIERDSPRSPVQSVDWVALLRRWAEDYRFTTSNRVGTYLEPRTLPRLMEKLRTYGRRYAVTGSFAAIQWAPIAPARLASIFVEHAERFARDLDLKPTEAGINVLLAEPFDPVVFERAKQVKGITYASPAQVVADQLHGPGRAPQEAEALLRWMAGHERAWRG